MIYDLLPSELLKPSARFTINHLHSKSRYEQLEESLYDLSDSKTVNIIYNSSDPTFGFELAKTMNTFKIYPNDSGLLVTSIYKENNLSTEDIYKKIIFGNISVNFGRIFESITAQSLISMGYTPYYHTYQLEKDNNKQRYEIDFMISMKGKPTAIEVKSGNNFTTNSLDNLKIKYPQIKMNKILVSNKPFKKTDSITYLPIYMLFCLEK